MRLAGHTYSFRDRPLPAALDELARLGFTAVEVWAGHSAADPGATADALDERGLRAVAVSAGGIYEGGGLPTAAFELAAELAAPVVVACVSPSRLPDLPRLAPQLLCVENHWDQRIARPADALRALRARDDLGACLDTGHAILAGVRPDAFALALGAHLRHVHLKDASPPGWRRLLGRRLRLRLLPRPLPVIPGDGALDIPGLLRALERVGFDGTVSLEYEGSDAAPALAALLGQWKSAGASSVRQGSARREAHPADPPATAARAGRERARPPRRTRA